MSLRWLRSPEAAPTRPWWWVFAGLAAVVVLVGAQAADLPGLLERGASWWRVVVSFVSTSVLLLAWWQLGPRWRRPILTTAIWTVPLMFTFPLHSRDSYAYAATGWLVARGQDAYTVPLGEAGQAGLLVGTHWHETTSVYPALSLELFGAISRLTGGDPYWTTVALRLPSLMALAILAFVLPRLARRFAVDPAVALWAGLMVPIMTVQWVGGVHNDALMVALGVAALWAATDLGWRGWRGLIVAGVLLGLAMGVKQSAALFGLGVVAVGWAVRRADRARSGTGSDASGAGPDGSSLSGWLRLAATAVVPGLITIAVFLLTSLRLGLGWRNPTAGNPVGATSNAPLSWVASFLRYNEVFPETTANALVNGFSTLLILAAVIALWVWVGPRGDSDGRPWLFAVGVLTAFMVFAPALQPWYVTWILPLYAFCGVSRRWDRWWLVAVLAFGLLPALQDALPAYVSMGIVGVPLYFVWRELRRRDVDPLPASA